MSSWNRIYKDKVPGKYYFCMSPYQRMSLEQGLGAFEKNYVMSDFFEVKYAVIGGSVFILSRVKARPNVVMADYWGDPLSAADVQ